MGQSCKPVKLYSEDSEGIATEGNLETCLELVEEGLLEYYSLTETYTVEEMMDTQYAFEAVKNFVIDKLSGDNMSHSENDRVKEQIYEDVWERLREELGQDPTPEQHGEEIKKELERRGE